MEMRLGSSGLQAHWSSARDPVVVVHERDEVSEEAITSDGYFTRTMK